MDNVAIDTTETFMLVNSTQSLLNCTEAISENCLITSEDGTLESALFAVLFCVVFILLLALLLLLICKVWSLRRSVVPSIYKIDQTTGAVVSAPNMTAKSDYPPGSSVNPAPVTPVGAGSGLIRLPAGMIAVRAARKDFYEETLSLKKCLISWKRQEDLQQNTRL